MTKNQKNQAEDQRNDAEQDAQRDAQRDQQQDQREYGTTDTNAGSDAIMGTVADNPDTAQAPARPRQNQ